MLALVLQYFLSFELLLSLHLFSEEVWINCIHDVEEKDPVYCLGVDVGDVWQVNHDLWPLHDHPEHVFERYMGAPRYTDDSNILGIEEFLLTREQLLDELERTVASIW